MPLAQGGIEVGQTFEMSPAEGPIGTSIELRVKGVGWRTMESTWVINWDNQEVGLGLGDGHARHGGRALPRERAASASTSSSVLTGYMGQGYLNHEQAPNAYLPRPAFVFQRDAGPDGAVCATPNPTSEQPVPASEASSEDGAREHYADARVRCRRARRSVRAVFRRTHRCRIVWGTQEGSRVSGNGFAPKETELEKLDGRRRWTPRRAARHPGRSRRPPLGVASGPAATRSPERISCWKPAS